MKRGLLLSLCAAALVAMNTPALAAVDAQLNLRYTDPNDPTAGGTWELLAQSDSGATNGISGIRGLIGGATGVTGIDTGSVTPNAALWNNTTDVFRFQPINAGATVEVVTGDELEGTLLKGVGTGGSSAGNVAKDDLFPGAANPWDNSALIASGTFGATRPTLSVEANEFSGTAAVAATIGTTSVRGDSVGVDGLKLGDADRNGVVNSGDLNVVLSNFNSAGAGWDQGNFDSANGTNSGDLNLVLSNFNASSATPPIGAVPEPATAVLFMAGVACLSAARYRKESH